ncbi:MAG: hypothetical protein ABI741_14465 [Ferruginibacter sp.]
MEQIIFNPRWREELEAISDEGILIFELTVGKMHVYFPDEGRWRISVPDWAKEKWDIYLKACSSWCKQNMISLSIVSDAHVYEEKAGG